MKRIISMLLLALIAVFVFTSCSGGNLLQPSPPDIDTAYKIAADITYDDFTAKASLERNAENNWTVTFSEPFALSGLKLTFADGNVTADLDGISVTVTENEAYTTLMTYILSALENAATGEGFTVLTTDDIIQVSGQSDYGAYTLKFNKETKAPLSLQFEGKGINVAFSDMTEITSDGTVDAVIE